ncbi:NUDIX hydrolase [Aeromicrobium sp. CF3.5]|uniref:NUDIX hydrolase n=1 Tax=Aeromicrobium sp. CF3.5 TaxID=3373078 RepID=UPI003EE575BF
MTSRIPLSGRLREAAEAAAGDPVVPRDAATIVVVRDGAAGIEAFLMRRQTTMAFAAGFYVFPGGSVHPSDHEDMPWVGPDAEQWGSRWRCDPQLARALVVAAVRETFEETAVLLAGPDESTVLSDTSTDAMEQARDDLEEGRLSFGDFLRREHLVLRADLVGAWAHWITPRFEPRRYDTRFFVAALPHGQRVGAMSREADRASWMPLAEVLRSIDAGDASMMPPTIATCREVARHTAATVVEISRDRRFETIVPHLVDVDGELFLETNPGESS